MENEIDNQIEYRAGDKQGLVDFEAFRVVQEVRGMVPLESFATHQITFSQEDLHPGIIAVLLSEMMPAFQDGEVPSLVVSETTLKVLELLGISYQKVENQNGVIEAEDIFSYKAAPLQQTGD